MNDRLAALEEDIGFLKALATEGRPATLIGGSILVAAGLIFGLASLGQWAALEGFLPRLSGWIFSGVWGVSLIAFMIAFALIMRRLGPRKREGGGSRAVNVAWSSAGISIFTLVVCAVIVAYRTGSDAPMALLPSIILAHYGLAWSIAAVFAQRGWVWAAAVGSFVGAAVTAFFAGQAAIYLVYAAELVLLAVLPGAFLIRRAGVA
jgi:hypothetical protein